MRNWFANPFTWLWYDLTHLGAPAYDENVTWKTSGPYGGCTHVGTDL